MNSNTYQMSDDWGWFVDIECNDFSKNILVKPINAQKKIKHRFNLSTIEEDEYEYYHRNYKDPEENYDTNVKTGESNIFINVGSTTLITALLTYVIFFIM